MIWMMLACTGVEDLPPEGSQDPGECSDGFDNDLDGDVDCGDADCQSVRDDCDDVGRRDTDDRPHTGFRHSDWWRHSDDSACDEMMVAVDAISMNCDSTTWWYDVYSTGWMSSPELWIFQTGADTPWDEGPHPFPSESFDYGANGCWDNFYMELDITTEVDEVVYGETSLYECSNARKNTLSWHLVIYDVLGSEADCAVWGDDPDSLGTGCPDWS